GALAFAVLVINEAVLILGHPPQRVPRRVLEAGSRAKDAGASAARRSPYGSIGWSRHEIFPPLVTSPAVFGLLSRRAASVCATQNVCPMTTGLVGVSSGPALRSPVAPTGFRKNSLTEPFFATVTIAFRSFAAPQITPDASRTIPSSPSRYGCCTNRLSRHSVSGEYVESQPCGLVTLPWASNARYQIAPRAGLGI